MSENSTEAKRLRIDDDDQEQNIDEAVAENNLPAAEEQDQNITEPRAQENAVVNDEDDAENELVAEGFDYRDRELAFRRSLQTIDITPRVETNDLNRYLRLLRTPLNKIFNSLLDEHHSVKIWITVKVEYEKLKMVKEAANILIGYLATPYHTIFSGTNVDETIVTINRQISERNINFMRDGSGCRIKALLVATVDVAKFNPLIGKMFAKLPEFLAHKKAIINVKNLDNRCFGYAMLAALNPQISNPQQPSALDKLFLRHRLANIQYPVAAEQLPFIERELGIALNVYGFYDDKGMSRYPIYVSNMKVEKQIDLLYWDNHYAWIKNFSAFLGDINKHKGKTFWCKRCLGHFCKEDSLKKHQEYCSRGNYDSVLYTLPPEGTRIAFINQRYPTNGSFRNIRRL